MQRAVFARRYELVWELFAPQTDLLPPLCPLSARYTLTSGHERGPLIYRPLYHQADPTGTARFIVEAFIHSLSFARVSLARASLYAL